MAALKKLHNSVDLGFPIQWQKAVELKHSNVGLTQRTVALGTCITRVPKYKHRTLMNPLSPKKGNCLKSDRRDIPHQSFRIKFAKSHSLTMARRKQTRSSIDTPEKGEAAAA